jgi:hypothetical protein
MGVTYFHTLREIHTLRVHENRMVRRIFGTKEPEVSGKLRKFH